MNKSPASDASNFELRDFAGIGSAPHIHINTGILFLITGFLHIYYNWKPILSYLKNQSRQLKIFTKNFNIALFLTLFVALGTYFEIPPGIWLIDAGSAIKDSAAIKYGAPPHTDMRNCHH